MDSGFDGFQKVLNNIAHYLHRANFTFSFVSVFINIFHFIILTRKSMRTSSTNVVMIGIAISDSCTMLTTIYKHYQLVDVENPECVTSAYKYKIYMDLVAWSFQDHFRRCSSWMGVLMATVRLVIMKKMTDNNCAEYQDVTSRPPYSVMLTPLFSFNDMIVLRVYVMFDAIVTKFIPCISFPILTVFLLRQLRKFHNLGPSNGRKQSVANEERNELTTKLIVFMTIAFFIAEAPLGMIYMVKVFFNRSDQIFLFSIDIVIYFTFLLTLNSISHSIFCVFMSSQYRDTIRKMIGIRGRTKLSSARNKTSVASVNGIRIN